MAIYYIDPHTTVNGTGTWASPWSLSTAHTGLVNGDEIRIKGVALTSLLTATVYTATFTSQTVLTITAGGSLGTDFPAGSIVYIPQFDTFFKVYSNSATAITAYTNGVYPIPNTALIGASLTIRKVDTTTYPASSTINLIITGPYTSLNSITVSDCWIDAVTRVTDGTVKTLMTSSATSNCICYLNSSNSGLVGGNFTMYLDNTHILSGTSPTFGYISLHVYGDDNNISINQIWSSYSPTGTGFVMGTSAIPANYNIIYVKYFGPGPLFASNVYGYACSFTFDTVFEHYGDYLFGSGSTLLWYAKLCSVTITNIIAYSSASATSYFNISGSDRNTFTFNGTYDYFQTTSLTNLLTGFGTLDFIVNPSAVIKYNKRVSTVTGLANGLYPGIVFGPGCKQTLITVPDFTGVTYTSKYPVFTGQLTPTTYLNPASDNSSEIEINYPVFPTGKLPYGNTYGFNILVTSKDGTDPVDILSVRTPYFTQSASSNFPVVSLDRTIYKTTGPSLKAYLGTRINNMWLSGSFAAKTMRIPVTANTSYTLSGYFRTDDATYAAEDAIRIYQNGVKIAEAIIYCYNVNTWTAFSVTFTPTITGEVIMSWIMYFNNGAKSHWIDDLTIV